MKLIYCIAAFAIVAALPSSVSAQDFVEKIKEKSVLVPDEKTHKAADRTLNNDTDIAVGDGEQESGGVKQSQGLQKIASDTPTLKVYQNYDFVPGDKILFEDNFIGDVDGEFPAHWELMKGQAVLNKVANSGVALYLTDGNYARVKPRMKSDKYLKEPFTIEFDYYHIPGSYGLLTSLVRIDKDCNCESESSVQVTENEASFSGSVSLSKTYAEELSGEAFSNRWHHIAIAVKNHQLKVYVDQNRILVVPDTKDEFYAVQFAGIGDETKPIIFKNLRIASGGDMNMIGKKFTENKIVTHGINFDVDKATIKPESMGTLNMIVNVLKDNPDLKFSIEGHTDNSGTPAHNLSLSQQRAEAVKTQLVAMGVDAARLAIKGFGDTKPISDNTTLEGKANNRRVEFVKL